MGVLMEPGPNIQTHIESRGDHDSMAAVPTHFPKLAQGYNHSKEKKISFGQLYYVKSILNYGLYLYKGAICVSVQSGLQRGGTRGADCPRALFLRIFQNGLKVLILNETLFGT